MRTLAVACTTVVLLAAPAAVSGAVLSVSPEPIVQGGTALIRIAGVTSTAAVASLEFDGVPARTLFVRDGAVVGLAGIDLRRATGTVHVRAALVGGQTLTATATVVALPKPEVVFSIPESLGGDTPAAQRTLLTTLAAENAALAVLWTNPRILWREPFRFPVADAAVTDGYGYLRATGAVSLAHKGTDFRAPVGTPVYAMNRGVVRLVRTFRNYGKTVVVDHGRGLQTLYMHLSKTHVMTGQLVLPGQLIARSGETGYALGPHLHVSVRIGGISVDPERFLSVTGSAFGLPSGRRVVQ